MQASRVLALLAALSTTAFAASYKDATTGFQLTYPDGWTVKTKVMGAAVAVLAPPSGGFSRNVNVVVVEGAPKGTVLDTVYQQNLGSLRKLVTDFKVVSEQKVSVGGQPGRQLIYTGRQGQYNLRQEQRYLLSGGRLYVITATGLASDAGALKALDPVINSFKLGQ